MSIPIIKTIGNFCKPWSGVNEQIITISIFLQWGFQQWVMRDITFQPGTYEQNLLP